MPCSDLSDRVFVLLFDSGSEVEGIHTLELNGRTVVLMFEEEDDALRYAGLLAAQILSVADSDLARKLEDYRSSLHDAVVAKDARLVDLGSTDYLSQMNS